MATMTVEELYEKYVKERPAADKMKLLEIARKDLDLSSMKRPRRKWSEISGAVTYPMVAEDAQSWVSRSRAADDERSKPLK
jgi:hypothetical protein